MNKGDYIVAFAYTREVGGYEGVITWTSFPSKEYFNRWYTKDIKKRQRVVEEGITSEHAIELASSTPRACTIAAAVQDATNHETGEINQSILDIRLKTAILAKRL